MSDVSQTLNGEENNQHCGKDCLPMILVQQEIRAIKGRLERGDKSLYVLPQLLNEVRSLATEVRTLSEGVGQTKDIVTAWGNIRGFGNTMKAISAGLKVTAIVASSVGTIYLLFNHPDEALKSLFTMLKAKD